MNALVEKIRSWRTVRLGDLAKTSSGGTPKRGVAAYYGGAIPWVKSGELGDSTVYETQEKISQSGLDGSSAKLFPKGTLCVALYGATVGKLGILGIDAATNQAVCGIFLPDEIDTRFAYRFLESKRRELIELGKGGAQSNISQEIIRDLQFPLPPPDEQRRIVEEIEKQFTRLDAGVAALRRVQANLKRYRAAVLKAACEGRLVPTEAELARGEDRNFETGEELLARILAERRKKWQGRGHYKEPTTHDTKSAALLPEGWTWASLEQISRSSSYGTSAKCSPDNSGPPVLRIPNIAGGRVDLSDLKFASVGQTVEADEELTPGDLLIIRTNGSKSLIGRSAVVRQNFGRATTFASYLIRFRLFALPTLFDWVATIWDVSFLRSWIEQRAATSAGQHNISMSALSRMPIPLPPLAEQTRIAAEVERRLSGVEELEATVSANLQRATRLRQSILQNAFSGNL